MRSLTSLIEIAEDNNGFHLVPWHAGYTHIHREEAGPACRSAPEEELFQVDEKRQILIKVIQILVWAHEPRNHSPGILIQQSGAGISKDNRSFIDHLIDHSERKEFY